MAITMPAPEASTSASGSQAATVTESVPCTCILRCMAQCLPAYSPSPPAPDYSHSLACGERSLQHSLGPGFRHRNPEHTFTQKTGKVSLTLRGQEPGVKVPWYGRDEIITGFVSVDPERVTDVSLQIEGRLSISLLEHSKVVTVVNSETNLWKKDRASNSSLCPSEVEFAFSLPETYESGGKEYPLPPSFHEHSEHSGIAPGPYINVRSSYRIHISVTKAPKSVFNWEKTEHAFLTFDYLPQSRSRDPTSGIPGSLASIKALPNEWYQCTGTVAVENQPHLEPLTTNLFVPNARVYPITEDIPFHIQVSGRVDSLRASIFQTDKAPSQTPSPTLNFAIESKKKKRLSMASTSKTSSSDCPFSSLPPTSCSKPRALRVSVLRQICVDLKGKKQVKNVVIAEGDLEPVPPMMTDCYCYPVDHNLEYLSWEGNLKINPDVRTGGFEGENIKVCDYVTLAIGTSEVPWKDVKCSIGIKLVTDSWEDPPEVQL
ncbi:hypothetical protein D9611_013371 [Ephemerocybe angulata]|uniref:Uncharacterized protein n=1 Tax=Ephemerocybe angulata TaxID=980116 RepID=A0A8H5CCT7_9AGAR|nr:hypothetical protein D9611_013371 [Tulosesus angulatus]